MCYYGINGNILIIFKSFMTDKTQYVTIYSFISDILNSPMCSVIQGSKLSAIIYTLYTNEITYIYKLINNLIFSKLTSQNPLDSDTIDHTTINYIDDLTNHIFSTNGNQLKKYIDNYYKLLEAYYNINFFKINHDKKLLLTCKPKFREMVK